MQFCWSTYLSECNSEAVPDAAFIQVEKSLTSEIQPLQTVEILQSAQVPQDYITDIVKLRSEKKSHIPQENPKSSSSLVQCQPALKTITTNSKQSLSGSATYSIEKSNKYASVTTYWIAQVTTVCGPLLRVRYVLPTGYSALEFWVQVGSDELKHIGYSTQNGLIPALPTSVLPCTGVKTEAFVEDTINEQDAGQISINSSNFKLNLNSSSSYFRGRAADVLVFISNITSCYVPVAKEALSENTRPYFKRIEPGKFVEVLEDSSRKCGWPAIVLQNVGGRLLLRHICTSSTGAGRDDASCHTASSGRLQTPAIDKKAVFDSNCRPIQDASRSMIKTDASNSVAIIDNKNNLIEEASRNIITQDARSNTPLLYNRSSIPMQDWTNSAILPESSKNTTPQDVTTISKHVANSSTSMQDSTSSKPLQDISSDMLKEDSTSFSSTENTVGNSGQGITSNGTTQGSSITSTQDSTSSCPTFSTSCHEASLDAPCSTVIHCLSSNLAVDDVSCSSKTHDTSMCTKVTDNIPPCCVPLDASCVSTVSQDVLLCKRVLDNAFVDALVDQGQCSGTETRHKPSPNARVSLEALDIDNASSDLVSHRATHKASSSSGEGQNSSVSTIEGLHMSVSKGEGRDSSVSKIGRGSSLSKEGQNITAFNDGQKISANKDGQNISANNKVQNIVAIEDQNFFGCRGEGPIISVSKGEGLIPSFRESEDQNTSVINEYGHITSISKGAGRCTSVTKESQDTSGSKGDIHCSSGCSKVTKDTSSITTPTQEEFDCRGIDHDGSSHMMDTALTFPRSNGASNISVISMGKEDVSGSKEESKNVFLNSESTQIEPFGIKHVQDFSADSCITLCSFPNNKDCHTAFTNSSQSERSFASNKSLQEKADQCMATQFDIMGTSDILEDKPINGGTTGCCSSAGETVVNMVGSYHKTSSVCLAVTAKEASCSETSDDGNLVTASRVMPKVPDTLTCSPSGCVEASFLEEFWLFCTNERLRNVGWSSSPGRQCYRHQQTSDKTMAEGLSCVWLECVAHAVSVPLPVGGHPITEEYSSQLGRMPDDEDSLKPKASVPDKVNKNEIDGLIKDKNTSFLSDGHDKVKPQPSASEKYERMEVDCMQKAKDGSIPNDGNAEESVLHNNSCQSVNSVSQADVNDSKLISKDGLLTCKIKPGMVLEIIHPLRLCCVHAALVTKVWSEDQVELRFDACLNDKGLVTAGNTGQEEQRDTGCILPSSNSFCQQLDLNEVNLVVEDLVFDEVSCRWKWKIHVRDYHILPAGFCSQHNIPLHPLLEVKGQSNTTQAVERVKSSYTMVTDHSSSTELPCDSNPKVEKKICCSGCNVESDWTFPSHCVGNRSSLKSEHMLNSICKPSKSQSSNQKQKDNSGNFDAPSILEDCPTEKISGIMPDQSLIKIEAKELIQGNLNEIVDIDVEIVEKIPNIGEALTSSVIETKFVVDETVSSTTLSNNIVSNDEDQMEEVTLLVDDSLLCGAGKPKQSDGDTERRKCVGDLNAAFSWKCSPWRSLPSFKTTVQCPMAVELGFSEHQKLETVHPRHPSFLCVATIVSITGHLLWIRLDSKDDASLVSAREGNEEADHHTDGDSSEHILFHISCSCQKSIVVVRPCNSDEIFPAGWAQSHDAMFRIPRSCRPMDHEIDQESLRTISSPPRPQTPAPFLDDLASSSRWCPQLHLHYTCCPGPFLSRTKLACQPGVAVAGPVASVLVQVVAQSLAAGFCPTKLTKDLATALQGVARPDWALMDIKAKCKRYSVRGTVLAPAMRRDVPAFLDQLHAVLQCCPNLWSHTKRAVCPYHCKQPAPALATTGRRRPATLPSSVSLLGATRQPGDEDLEEEDDDGEDDHAPGTEWGDEGGVDPCEDEADTSWLRSNMKSGDASLKRARSESSVHTSTDGVSKKRKASRSWAIQPADVDKDPLTWSVNDVYEFVSKESSVCHHASWLRRERVDGRALLLLNLASLVHQLRLPHRALLPLAHLLCRLKMAHLLKRGVE